ncbi:MAG: acetylornithine deacetylase [Alphaproteobacteria bacterium]|nr:acetylornithine deacetylase [Alphaproteobacteria bacterium]
MNTRQILDKLISFPTVPRTSTKDLIDWAANLLRESGAVVECLLSPDGTKANLWARLGPSVEGGIILAGHIDVVPVEGQSWTSDPFRLTERDGKLYGRGACDMKGFVACALSFAARVDVSKLTKPIYIALTYDEETDMSGALTLADALTQRGIKADWIWLGEPTGLEVITAHKGVLDMQTIVEGVAAHSSLPSKGLNAIALTNKIISWLVARDETYAKNPVEESHFDPPYSTINLGIINGGKAPNIIADRCLLEWGVRLHPNAQSAEELLESYQNFVEQEIKPLMTAFPATQVKTTARVNIPPFACGANNLAATYLLPRTGSGSPLSVSYATEAGYYAPLAQGLAICGPGSILQAHQPDEYVPQADLDACDRLLDGLVG